MKTTKLLLLSLLALVLFSCSDDDEPGASNTIVFAGESYLMTDGVAEDYGPSTPADGSSNETHYNYDFTIVDGTLEAMTDEFDDTEYRSDDATFGVYIELFSPGTSGFQSGTFNFISDDDAEEFANIKDRSFFSGAEAYLITGLTDSDGDPTFIDFDVIGGSVTVSGTSVSNYKITYDLKFSEGRTLTGSYSGNFHFSDEKDAD